MPTPLSVSALSDVTSATPPDASSRPRRTLQRMRAAESLHLAGGVPLGRILFSLYGVPTIRPVNHIVEDGNVIFRTHEGAAVVESIKAGGVRVAYEVDEFDIDSRLGWSVVVNGTAALVEDPRETERYLALTDPWLDNGKNKNIVVRISPDVVFGFRVIPGETA